MIRWVIQNNLISENDLCEIQEACVDIGVEFQEVLVVPFSDELPKFIIDDKINIYYGATTFMNNIYEKLNKPIGLFYDDKTFSMQNYKNKWGKYMLNSEGIILTVLELFANKSVFGDDENVFVRPDGDGKEFDGQVMKYKDIIPYVKRHIDYESPLNIFSKILIGPAYNIYKEWRNYIVDGEIVSSSLYCKNFRLSKSNTDIPEDMLDFVMDRIKEYSPHKNFAIDIASTHDGEYYIIECGFYHSDIKKIVKAITNSVK